jgi:ABC-type histidine transport system ATPase subunit
MDEGIVVDRGTPDQLLKNTTNPRIKQFLNLVSD